MKIIKLFVIVLVIVMLSVSCTSSDSTSDISITVDGIIKLCEERSNGNSEQLTQCISEQCDACDEILTYLNLTKQVEKYYECVRMHTDDENRTDLVMISECLGTAI